MKYVAQTVLLNKHQSINLRVFDYRKASNRTLGLLQVHFAVKKKNPLNFDLQAVSSREFQYLTCESGESDKSNHVAQSAKRGKGKGERVNNAIITRAFTYYYIMIVVIRFNPAATRVVRADSSSKSLGEKKKKINKNNR